MENGFQISIAVILNALLITTVISALQIIIQPSKSSNIISIFQLIFQSILPQVCFAALLLITGGDFRIFKISNDKAVYGIAILNGLFGKWIFKKISGLDKEMDLFEIVVRFIIRILPFSEDVRNKIIEDYDKNKKEKKEKKEEEQI